MFFFNDDKYNVQNLNDILGQDSIIDFLNNTINNNFFNNYIFHGMPGCGKTSTAFLYIKKLYGSNYQKHLFEINSSDFRGINIFKMELNDFISNDSSYTKTIILDEADNITIDAQIYLLKLMEKCFFFNNKKINFIIICNYINKINIQIINKCIVLKFKKIKYSILKKKIKFIMNQ
jgi:DNA polymerase III delta prime subunit